MLKSSGTSPNFPITLASLKSPLAGSPVRLGFMDHMPSGRMSRSACSTRPAQIARVATRKMAAGPRWRNEELPVETLSRLMLDRLDYSGEAAMAARDASSFSWSIT